MGQGLSFSCVPRMDCVTSILNMHDIHHAENNCNFINLMLCVRHAASYLVNQKAQNSSACVFMTSVRPTRLPMNLYCKKKNNFLFAASLLLLIHSGILPTGCLVLLLFCFIIFTLVNDRIKV
jgi:hypothetical protein